MAGFDKGKIKSRVHSWFNLGFDQGMAGTYRKARPYNIHLASDNIEFLPHACLFSVAAFAVTALFFLITSGCITGVAVAGAVAALAAAVVGFASKYEVPESKIPLKALALTAAFCVIWYAFSFYVDVIVQPAFRSILTCLAFLALPLMFDARPVDNILGSAMAFVAFLALEVAFVPHDVLVFDVLGVLLAISVGILFSQRKTASKLKEIIYLDMYRTATKASILVAQFDIAADAFYALQMPDYLGPVNESVKSATKAIELVGRKFVDPQFVEAFNRFFDLSTMAKRFAECDQATFTFLDFRNRWCEATLIAQSQVAGEVSSAVVIVRDVDATEREKLTYQQKLRDVADEARRANASKTNFLRRMSHDVRTPINGICGMVEIADRFPDDMEKQAECRTKAREASGFLLSLVNNVLDMNKLESGTIELEHVPFDLLDVSRKVSSIVHVQAVEHGVTLSGGSRGKGIAHRYLLGSPVHLQQILLNLGSNAAKYNKPGGSLAIDCHELSCDGRVAVYEITCEDTGIGMSSEFQKHAFEPFAQDEQHATTTYTGSGLGLAIVKELVERMGGTIKLESEEGVGTKFTIVMPFELDLNHESNIEEKRAIEDLSGKRALLVEDDDLNAEIAQFLLEQEGMEVQRAVNGAQAVEVFETSSVGYFDVVFMDIMMPVMGGLDAARAIRACKRPDADVPIFAMTANAFQDDRHESLAAGMTEHLTKPLEIEKIREVVGRALAQR